MPTALPFNNMHKFVTRPWKPLERLASHSLECHERKTKLAACITWRILVRLAFIGYEKKKKQQQQHEHRKQSVAVVCDTLSLLPSIPLRRSFHCRWNWAQVQEPHNGKAKTKIFSSFTRQEFIARTTCWSIRTRCHKQRRRREKNMPSRCIQSVRIFV